MIFYEQHAKDFTIGETTALLFPSHLHRQIELLVCLKGRMKATCDFHTYILQPGDWLVVLPECEHSYVEAEDFQGVLMIFNPRLISHLSLYFKKKLLCPAIHNEDALLQDCALRLMENREKPLPDAVIKGCLYVIMGTLLEENDFLDGSAETGEPVVEKILDYLSANFTEEITLHSLAGQFGLSHFYVSHLFQDKLGCSFLKYLHTLRIDYAKYLLKNSEKTVTEVCYECGFATQRTFNRVFLQITGCTPNKYRQRRKI